MLVRLCSMLALTILLNNASVVNAAVATKNTGNKSVAVGHQKNHGSDRSGNVAHDKLNSFINNFLSQTFSTANRGNITPELIASMERDLSNGIDYQWIGLFVMGNVFSMASSAQKEALVETYKKHLVYSYIPLILKYKQVRYNIRTTNNVGNNTYIASVDIKCQNCRGRPINIIYRIRLRGDNFMIYDMIIEGNSFLASQRTSFKSIIGQAQSVDALLDHINKENSRLQRAIPMSRDR